MPLDLGPLPVRFTATIQDRDRNTGSATAYRNGFVTLAELEASLAAFEAAIALMTDGYIIGGSISIPLVQTTVPTEPLPPESSDVQRKASAVFRQSNGRTAKYEIPSPSNLLVVDGSNVLDRASAAVLAYEAFMLNNAVLGSVSGNGLALTRLESIRKIHRADSEG